MLLRQIADPQLSQYSYLIACEKTGQGLIIDPERDIDRYIKIAEENSITITAVTETHIHADFVSGVQEFAADPSIEVYLSNEGAPDWTYNWAKNHPNIHYVKNRDHFNVGTIRIDIIHTPGHTPEHICFLINDLGAQATIPLAIITGDFIFVGDIGRPDLLETAVGVRGSSEKSAETLAESITRHVSKFEDSLLILPAHGSGSACGKKLGAVPFSSYGYEKKFNELLKLALKDKHAFVRKILEGQIDPPLYFGRMKKVNQDGIKVTNGIPQPKHLDCEQFLMACKQKDVTVLDTRTNLIAFHQNHFQDSLVAPLRLNLFSSTVGSFVDENNHILLIVENQEDVEIAARQLYRIGYDFIVGWISLKELQDAGLLNVSTPVVNKENFNTQTAKEYYVLDVRTKTEYEDGHLENALSIPYTRLMTRLDEIPKDKKLLVHCAKGNRASAAVSYLLANHYNATLFFGEIAPLLNKFR